ncbi:hypothetical protein [Microbacterium sp. W4I20]|uniref:hypothetical protein n=1 Tax=Microbacterium sp. W4I20 TaxID=3042262 RepID=UPI002780DDE6|nr:hypothetical protein [Microbacterium sp. W4I20]MDQ0727558.1 hypothetical protein [Microbacterium sp. W4I20]
MEWIADPGVGAWLRDRLEPEHSTMHGVVPHGFPAYARVFHPASARSLPDRPVPTSEEWERMPEAERARLIEQVVDVPATWAETAAAFGTTMHPLAQWQRIVRTPVDGDWRTRIAPDGREFTAPMEGALDPDVLSRIAAHLMAGTSTPDAGFAAVWEGFGGLLGFVGHSPSRVFVTFSDDPNHQAMLDRSTHDPFNNVFRKPTWQEGILSREISEGPRLSLLDRDYVVFSAPPRAFADPDWVLQVPWRDLPAEEHGFAPQAQSPNLLWPEDRAWVMVSEIDFDSTIVAGSDELVQALCADERLEAMPIPEGAMLTWDADRVNT